MLPSGACANEKHAVAKHPFETLKYLLRLSLAYGIRNLPVGLLMSFICIYFVIKCLEASHLFVGGNGELLFFKAVIRYLTRLL